MGAYVTSKTPVDVWSFLPVQFTSRRSLAEVFLFANWGEFFRVACVHPLTASLPPSPLAENWGEETTGWSGSAAAEGAIRGVNLDLAVRVDLRAHAENTRRCDVFPEVEARPSEMNTTWLSWSLINILLANQLRNGYFMADEFLGHHN